MHLLIIAGFAGSGKTTFLLELIKTLAEGGRRLAVIENDAGQIGIDGHLLRDGGLPVREIYSGCICCSLRIDLVNTLLELEREYQPDIVILEPSGVAGPRQVLGALEGYGGEIDSRRVVTLVDAERFQAIHNLFFPLFSDGIKVADLVVLNKSDRVDNDQLDDLRQRIHALREDATVLAMSALEGRHVQEITGRIRDWFPLRGPGDRSAHEVAADGHEHEHHHHDHDHDHKEVSPEEPAVFSHQIQWQFPSPMARASIQTVLRDFLTLLGGDLARVEGATLAHLKAIVRAGQGGYLLGSLTRCDGEPQLKGVLPRQMDSAEIIINAIVYGMDASNLEALALRRIQEIEPVWNEYVPGHPIVLQPMIDNANENSPL